MLADITRGYVPTLRPSTDPAVAAAGMGQGVRPLFAAPGISHGDMPAMPRPTPAGGGGGGGGYSDPDLKRAEYERQLQSELRLLESAALSEANANRAALQQTYAGDLDPEYARDVQRQIFEATRPTKGEIVPGQMGTGLFGTGLFARRGLPTLKVPEVARVGDMTGIGAAAEQARQRQNLAGIAMIQARGGMAPTGRITDPRGEEASIGLEPEPEMAFKYQTPFDEIAVRQAQLGLMRLRPSTADQQIQALAKTQQEAADAMQKLENHNATVYKNNRERQNLGDYETALNVGDIQGRNLALSRMVATGQVSKEQATVLGLGDQTSANVLNIMKERTLLGEKMYELKKNSGWWAGGGVTDPGTQELLRQQAHHLNRTELLLADSTPDIPGSTKKIKVHIPGTTGIFTGANKFAMPEITTSADMYRYHTMGILGQNRFLKTSGQEITPTEGVAEKLVFDELGNANGDFNVIIQKFASDPNLYPWLRPEQREEVIGLLRRRGNLYEQERVGAQLGPPNPALQAPPVAAPSAPMETRVPAGTPETVLEPGAGVLGPTKGGIGAGEAARIPMPQHMRRTEPFSLPGLNPFNWAPRGEFVTRPGAEGQAPTAPAPATPVAPPVAPAAGLRPTAPMPLPGERPFIGMPEPGVSKGEIVPGGGARLQAPRVYGRKELEGTVRGAAKKHDVPEGLMTAMAAVESSWNPGAVGDGGASTGLLQLNRRGAGAGYTAEQLKDPALNAELGAKYTGEMLRKYGGDVDKAIVAYNLGPGKLDRVLAKAAREGKDWKTYTSELGSSLRHLAKVKARMGEK